jgi:lipopolysaccharide cholinephosphotransferase
MEENKKDIRELQLKLIEMISFIDTICRENQIMYCIHGGTALGAVRHKGFIPWDDDLDIAMTQENFEKFKKVLSEKKDDKYFLQEWHIAGSDYVEYAKLRMNNTTFIEKQFMERKDLHQGIFVDIFILHKCPDNKKIQKKLFNKAHFIMGIGLSERGWKPKTMVQKIAFLVYKILPKKAIVNSVMKELYSYDNMTDNFQYTLFLDKGSLEKSIYDRKQIENPSENEFEGLMLYGMNNMDTLLKQIYGDYMTLPAIEQRKKDIHAEIWDVEKDYTEYIK